MDQDRQLARIIYHKWMSNMKFTLDLEEYSYKDKGRNDPRYRFFKKQLMANTYEALRLLFEELEDIGILCETEYDEDVKEGYKPGESGGSGYINSSRFNAWIKRELAAGNK
ncbi:hypothetical protein LCGC14_1357080 [marine sediment metagenome]|uniref:Uncharacterized protein n=1 Tax=marine sediment metagenome TaxID=412755 RepID=A0A0F9KV87_9ZZZZ